VENKEHRHAETAIFVLDRLYHNNEHIVHADTHQCSTVSNETDPTTTPAHQRTTGTSAATQPAQSCL
jgi:hypothetical protein